MNKLIFFVLIFSTPLLTIKCDEVQEVKENSEVTHENAESTQESLDGAQEISLNKTKNSDYKQDGDTVEVISEESVESVNEASVNEPTDATLVESEENGTKVEIPTDESEKLENLVSESESQTEENKPELTSEETVIDADTETIGEKPTTVLPEHLENEQKSINGNLDAKEKETDAQTEIQTVQSEKLQTDSNRTLTADKTIEEVTSASSEISITSKEEIKTNEEILKKQIENDVEELDFDHVLETVDHQFEAKNASFIVSKPIKADLKEAGEEPKLKLDDNLGKTEADKEINPSEAPTDMRRLHHQRNCQRTANSSTVLHPTIVIGTTVLLSFFSFGMYY